MCELVREGYNRRGWEDRDRNATRKTKSEKGSKRERKREVRE